MRAKDPKRRSRRSVRDRRLAVLGPAPRRGCSLGGIAVGSRHAGREPAADGVIGHTDTVDITIPFNSFNGADVRKTVRLRNINFNGAVSRNTGSVGIFVNPTWRQRRPASVAPTKRKGRSGSGKRGRKPASNSISPTGSAPISRTSILLPGMPCRRRRNIRLSSHSMTRATTFFAPSSWKEIVVRRINAVELIDKHRHDEENVAGLAIEKIEFAPTRKIFNIRRPEVAPVV